MPQLSLINLDGTDPKELVIGGWGSLSPDGSTVVYIESDGPSLMLIDTTTLQSRPIPGSVTEDYSAKWSPDGQWLAFVRTNGGLYISRPDGSGMRQVADASKIRFLVGWLTDSQLVMTSLGPEGSVGQVLDVNSGIAEDMFVIANVKGGFVKLSPDGKRVAFSEQMFGEPAYGIYVSNLDGSEKRLVSSLNSGVTSGAWSPDSQWLALAVMDDASGVTREAVIVQPDTCRVIRLPKLTGSIIGWGDAP
jgi:Tol biopolymer transport system component